MKLVHHETDQFVISFISRNYADACVVGTSNGLITYNVMLGGGLTVGLYSVPAETMPKKNWNPLSTGRMHASIYSPKTLRKREELRRLHPKILEKCDAYIVLSQRDDLDEHAISRDLIASTMPEVPKKHKERAGAVVWRELDCTGRVIHHSNVNLPKGANVAIQSVAGFNGPVVSYGTSDAANVFEFFQTLHSAAMLGIPCVFSTYAQSHGVRDYWSRVLDPSLRSIGLELEYSVLGLPEDAKFTDTFDPTALLQAIGFSWTRGDIPFAEFAQIGLEKCADRFIKANKLNVKYSIVALTQLLQHSPLWRMTLSQMARALHERVGNYSVVAFYDSNGNAVMSDQTTMSRMTVEEAHRQGYWLGGSAIYWAMYGLGKNGPIVGMVKDGSKGGVHRLAKPFLVSEDSGLHLLPVGLIRLSGEKQDEDASIDPWVFLAMLKRWRRADNTLRRIADAMISPLQVGDIGDKTVVQVNKGGAKITHK